ncbi:MAG: Beta-lactam-inducible penicillin-binding protein [Firmicutes bacterium ADurb.Bin182]|nr:MAG: Beta-lactam-inducible penicillin-binding protein [Firmicutes bacterium ADurb.Bin182]
MKKLLSLILIITVIFILTGCEKPGGIEICARFLNHIKAGEYEAAYDMLSASSRNDTGEPLSNKISKDEFIGKYKAIFDELQITGVSYEIFAFKEGEIITTADYTMTYFSGKAGPMTDEYRMSAIRESGSWRIEWTPSYIFPQMEWGDTVRVAKTQAKRGEILAEGIPLAANVNAVSVIAKPSKIEDEDFVVRQVAVLLNMTEQAVKKKLDSAYNDFTIIKKTYPDGIDSFTEQQLLLIPGIGIDKSNFGLLRDYPEGSLLSHILGYTGFASEEDLNYIKDRWLDAQGMYSADSIIGKSGLEYRFERELRGTDGSFTYIAAPDGSVKRTLYTQEVQDGLDIELTVDIELQRRAEELLRLTLFDDITAGAVIVMDPLTGRVDAMCSYPSYDLNLFTRGISEEDYQKLLAQKNKPLFNRLTQGLYPPGSLFKPFTAAAALESGAITPDYVFSEPIVDDYWIPSKYGHWQWSAIKRAEIKHREMPLNLHSAILHSDNIYFANAALLTGAGDFTEFVKAAGLGEAVPFELSVSRSQLLNESSQMNLMLLADSGYGQGEVLITPLQMASSFCAFANGGNIPVPFIVKAVYRTEGTEYTAEYETQPQNWKEGVIRKRTIDVLEPMMKDVVDPKFNGTGNKLRVGSCKIAGKTGTAQIGNDRNREIAWFAGYRTGVDDEDARLVLVMLEVPAGEEYNDFKFDIARKLLKMDKQQQTEGD